MTYTAFCLGVCKKFLQDLFLKMRSGRKMFSHTRHLSSEDWSFSAHSMQAIGSSQNRSKRLAAISLRSYLLCLQSQFIKNHSEAGGTKVGQSEDFWQSTQA
jgi:hypothetical protein